MTDVLQNDSQNPASDWLLPLSNGTGFERERLEYVKETLDNLARNADHNAVCLLNNDERNHPSVFYLIAQHKKEILKVALHYEKFW